MSGASASLVRREPAAGVTHGRLALRVQLLAVAAVALLTGLCGGLGRLGWSI